MADLVVLVVDDDPSIGEALALALAGSSLRVETALSAEKGMQLLSARQYCGLVLDVVLDDGSGFDVLRFMERQNIAVPTIVVTEKLPAYVREMLNEDQVKLVFPKPFETRLLATVVLGLCGF
jgi:DNA-binding response OmpR family regulator